MREITFYYPSKSFPVLSVTGGDCALDCTHCRKTFLKKMIPTPTPESLIETCLSLWKKGAVGVLVSGGCDAEGRVPLFFDALRKVREKTGLIFNLHTGLVDYENIEDLKKANPHCVSFDMPTDYSLKNIYGLKRKSKDYVESLGLLKARNLNVVPHLCLGMNTSMEEEKDILKRISGITDKVVLNIVFAARGTDFEKRRTDEGRIIDFFTYARPLFKRIILGCMRPRKRKIEEEALILDGIVQPTKWARVKAQELGLNIREKNTCCVVE